MAEYASEREYFANEFGIVKTPEWEIQHSSLKKISKGEVTYEECRRYACEDIAKSLTRLPNTSTNTNTNIPFVLDIPENTAFHFIGRVATGGIAYNPNDYYGEFNRREFVSFSTINKKNISHYRGKKFLVYDILPDDIVHIFPMDSATETNEQDEAELTIFPSLWLTLRDLEELTLKLQVYNQVTCRTKRDGKIIKPFAIIAIEKLDEENKAIAERFGIGCIIVHPDSDAVNYTQDLLYDWWKLQEVSEKMKELYGMNTQVLYEIP